MRTALLPSVRTSLSVCECGAAGCYLPLCLPLSSPLLSQALSVYLSANVGPQGQPVFGLHAPFVPHSASVGRAMQVLSTPVPVSAPPTSLDVCFFFVYLVSDFLAV